MLRAGGTRGAFGSDGKAIQVGLAASAGVQAALLARAGAAVDRRVIHGPLGFEGVLGATWVRPGADGTIDGRRAIDSNWIKLHPSCLGTHSPIEAAAQVRARGDRFEREQITILVHPRARQAAYLDAVTDGIAAKFSIPYCVAYTLRYGPPHVRDFASIDAAARDGSRWLSVNVEDSLPEFGARLTVAGQELARVNYPRGGPERPVAAAELAAKVADLAGDRLTGIFEERRRPRSCAQPASDH